MRHYVVHFQMEQSLSCIEFTATYSLIHMFHGHPAFCRDLPQTPPSTSNRILSTSRFTMSVFIEVFNHLVLPPQLPDKQDTNIESIGDAIIVRLIQATSTLSRLTSQEQSSPWYAIRQYLRRCQHLHENGRLEKQTMISKFLNFDQEQPLLLHIAEQNAALIVRYNSGYGSCSRSCTQHEPRS